MGRENNTSLTAAELARLRLEDGLAADGDVDRVDDSTAASDLALRANLSFVFSSVDVPPIADEVMRRIGGLRVPVSQSVEHEASAPPIASSSLYSSFASVPYRGSSRML